MKKIVNYISRGFMQVTDEKGSKYIYYNGDILKSYNGNDAKFLNELDDKKTLIFNIKIEQSKVVDIDLMYKALGLCNMPPSFNCANSNDLDDAIRNVQKANKIKNGVISIFITTDVDMLKNFHANTESRTLNVIALPTVSLAFTEENYQQGINVECAKFACKDATNIVTDKNEIITGCPSGCVCVSHNECLILSDCADNSKKSDFNLLTNVLREMKIPFAIFKLRKHFLAMSNEAFIFSIRNGIVPVVSLCSKKINNGIIGKTTQLLQKKFNVA